MSTALHLAGPDDLDKLLALVASFHAFENIDRTDDHRRAAVTPLLDGSPHGAVWLIGMRRAPVGYICISFGWSLELGGMDGFIDEFFIRETVRGRGMGTEVLISLLPQLAEAGVKALHLEVAQGNDTASRLYQKLGFKNRDKYNLMTWVADGPRKP